MNTYMVNIRWIARLAYVLIALWLPLGTLTLSAQNEDDAARPVITPENAAELEVVRALAGHTMPVAALDFQPDGDILASAGEDLSVRTWDVASGELLSESYPHNAAVKGVAFHPDGNLLATSAWDRSVRLFDVADDGTLSSRPSLTGFQHVVEPVAFDDSGAWLAYGVGDGTVHVVNTDGFSERSLFELDALKVSTLAFAPSPDAADRMLLAAATGFPDDSVVFVTTTGNGPAPLAHDHAGSVTSLAFSPLVQSGAVLLATAGDDGTLRLWRVNPGDTGGESFAPEAERVALIEPDVGYWFTDVAFHPAGDLLAAATLPGDVLVWDVSNPTGPERVITLATEPPARVNVLRFNNAGTLLATGGDDTQIHLWGVDGS